MREAPRRPKSESSPKSEEQREPANEDRGSVLAGSAKPVAEAVRKQVAKASSKEASHGIEKPPAESQQTAKDRVSAALSQITPQTETSTDAPAEETKRDSAPLAKGEEKANTRGNDKQQKDEDKPREDDKPQNNDKTQGEGQLKDEVEEKPADTKIQDQGPCSDDDTSDSPVENWEELFSEDDMTRKSDFPPKWLLSSHSEDDEHTPDPWNAICIVGVRVYSKDERLELRAVLENGESLEDEAGDRGRGGKEKKNSVHDDAQTKGSEGKQKAEEADLPAVQTGADAQQGSVEEEKAAEQNAEVSYASGSSCSTAKANTPGAEPIENAGTNQPAD